MDIIASTAEMFNSLPLSILPLRMAYRAVKVSYWFIALTWTEMFRVELRNTPSTGPQ